jgi:hypothetical protein
MASTNSSDTKQLLPEKMRALVVTHDVDWPRNGPGLSHVLARRDRFDADVIRKATEEGFNPYYGIPIVTEIEEQLHIRSTFFFRPNYDDGSTVEGYSDTIKDLIKNGWEVGLHVNDPSTVEKIISEKESIEKVTKAPVFGSRIHYLKVGNDTFSNLARAGLKYDSSLMYSKDKIDSRNTGFSLRDGLVVFPITFMDAYLFTYTGLNEENVAKFVLNAMDSLYLSGAQIIMLLWHDSSVMMKGGRAYSNLIRQIVDKPDLVFLKAIEAFEMVRKAKNH